jgi:hypothetical protein
VPPPLFAATPRTLGPTSPLLSIAPDWTSLRRVLSEGLPFPTQLVPTTALDHQVTNGDFLLTRCAFEITGNDIVAFCAKRDVL